MQRIGIRVAQLACLLMAVLVVGQLLGLGESGASLQELEQDLHPDAPFLDTF